MKLELCICLIFSMKVLSSAFVFGRNRAESLKREILELSKKVDRGISADPQDKEEMLNKFEQLEKLNPTRAPLNSPLVNGDWSLDYTTSDSILGKGGFPRVGPIIQMIDTKSSRAENSEVVNYFGLKVPRKVTAVLTPVNKQFTNVQFERFSIGPIGFDAPDSFKGSLDVTYLDEDFRLTRGDKGNIFVLT
eukprot:CAMPEP_0178981544 /NCGR_PEP_ID=MMETSP0789-20121207/27112_1 /TAXON_ID=3005 /ORGANISM="Rhizosolenia setigera, Strain CCMP 1694" /LENGTH=190 /DNA_ID=CAMNT_0020672083 /DNA_START=39 /DNA_END=607 /DNA_ORIENTATION=+